MSKNVAFLIAGFGLIVQYGLIGAYALRPGASLGGFAVDLVASPAAAMATFDLVLASLVFWAWMFRDGRDRQLTGVWVFVPVTLLGGLCTALPLYLYWRERRAVRAGEQTA